MSLPVQISLQEVNLLSDMTDCKFCIVSIFMCGCAYVCVWGCTRARVYVLCMVYTDKILGFINNYDFSHFFIMIRVTTVYAPLSMPALPPWLRSQHRITSLQLPQPLWQFHISVLFHPKGSFFSLVTSPATPPTPPPHPPP